MSSIHTIFTNHDKMKKKIIGGNGIIIYDKIVFTVYTNEN